MAKEEKEEQVASDAHAGKKKKPLIKLIMIGVAVLVIVVGGIFGFLFYKKSTAKKESPAQQQAIVGAIWPMEPFVVNLLDQGGDRYLRIVIELDVSDKNCLNELTQLKPKLRDSILELLTSKTYKEIIDPVGKQRLRDEIILRLNTFLMSGKVLKVYFTEFVIQ